MATRKQIFDVLNSMKYIKIRTCILWITGDPKAAGSNPAGVVSAQVVLPLASALVAVRPEARETIKH